LLRVLRRQLRRHYELPGLSIVRRIGSSEEGRAEAFQIDRVQPGKPHAPRTRATTTSRAVFGSVDASMRSGTCSRKYASSGPSPFVAWTRTRRSPGLSVAIRFRPMEELVARLVRTRLPAGTSTANVTFAAPNASMAATTHRRNASMMAGKRGPAERNIFSVLSKQIFA
jgi:hypothetical protein